MRRLRQWLCGHNAIATFTRGGWVVSKTCTRCGKELVRPMAPPKHFDPTPPDRTPEEGS